MWQPPTRRCAIPPGSATCREHGVSAVDGPRAFCRDCSGDLDFSARRCGQCGSPRLVRHRALATLSARPYRLRRLLCGGREARQSGHCATSRSSSAAASAAWSPTACYIARIFGVRSAMPMFKALKLCPRGRRDPARHGQICPRRARGAAAHAGADAAGRAAVDRRGLSRPVRHGARCTA